MNFLNITPTVVLAGAVIMLIGGTNAHSAGKYKVVEVNSGGTISGIVTYTDTLSSPKRVDVTTKEEVCHTDPIYSEKLVVSADKRIRWAIISIKSIKEGKGFSKPENPADAPTIDQNGCVFSPHVEIVPVGKPLKLINSDGVLHNVHTWPKKNRSKNIAMPGVIKEMSVKFRRPERIRITCDIHPWMEAYIVVAEHPYCAISDEQGEFTLTDVPPGTYTLKLWQETLGVFEQTVTVQTNTETKVEFNLSTDNVKNKDETKEGGS